MKIKMRPTERSIKLRDRKGEISRISRRFRIRQLKKEAKSIEPLEPGRPSEQTAEGNAADAITKTALSMPQKIAIIQRHRTETRHKETVQEKQVRQTPDTRETMPNEPISDSVGRPDPGEQSMPPIQALARQHLQAGNDPKNRVETATDRTGREGDAHPFDRVTAPGSRVPKDMVAASEMTKEMPGEKVRSPVSSPSPKTASIYVQPKALGQGEMPSKRAAVDGAIKSAKKKAVSSAGLSAPSTAAASTTHSMTEARKAAQKAHQKTETAKKTAKTAAKRAASAAKTGLQAAAKAVGQISAALFGSAAGFLAPLMVVLLLGALLCSPLGVFFSNDVENEMTLAQVMAQLNTEFSDKIKEIEASVAHDEVQQTGQRASWKEVLTIYAVKTTTGKDSPMDAASMDETHAAILRELFWAMNSINYCTETYTEDETEIVIDEDGSETEETQTVEKTRLLITVASKTAEQMAAEYGFTKEQLGYVTELLSEEYDEFWAMLAIPGGSDDMVAVALSQLGNVGGQLYWSWYGYTSRVSWCACFVSWCADQCGYIEAGVFPRFSYCDFGIYWFQQQGQWQNRSYLPAPGDIVFFDWDSDGISDHVGIVEYCDGSYVHTVEGNANDACMRMSYPVGSWKIKGYGVPTYN